MSRLTSACWPGFNTLPHSLHLRHSRCQSNPMDWRRSAMNKNKNILIDAVYSYTHGNISYNTIPYKSLMSQLTKVNGFAATSASPHSEAFDM